MTGPLCRQGLRVVGAPVARTWDAKYKRWGELFPRTLGSNPTGPRAHQLCSGRLEDADNWWIDHEWVAGELSSKRHDRPECSGMRRSVDFECLLCKVSFVVDMKDHPHGYDMAADGACNGDWMCVESCM